MKSKYRSLFGRVSRGLFAGVGLALLSATLGGPVSRAGAQPPSRRLLMAHYMPWFEASADGKSWGWHWTMNHYHPDRKEGARPEAASHYRPLIGLYDSDDPDALECHLQLMKLAGIDGVLIDWYGNTDYLDYARNHRCTEHLIDLAKRAGMKYGIVYEDQTVPRLIEGKRIPENGAVEHGQKTLQWLQEHWFGDPAYLRQDDHPTFLVFGSGYYQADQWSRIFAGITPSPRLFTESHRRAPAAGSFDWPQPKEGTDAALKEAREFNAQPVKPSEIIPAAFPRFHDIYAEAGVHPSWGRVEDREGKTYEETLRGALATNANVVQLVTWNDWSEGTQIEPSVEFGYRDLECTQRLRKEGLDPGFAFTPGDLRLPLELFRLRKAHSSDAAVRSKLDEISHALSAGHPEEARRLLKAAGLEAPN